MTQTAADLLASTPAAAVTLGQVLYHPEAIALAGLGYAGRDFTSNVIRALVEERLNLAVERPAAICHVTGLPTATPTTASTSKTTAAKK